MELYIGRSGSWDSMSFPEVHTWPLPADEEKDLIASYARLLKKAFLTYEAWKSSWRSDRLDDYFFRVEITAEKSPEKVYVVLGFHPEVISDVWAGRKYTRLRIDMPGDHKRRPAFASFQEAQQFAHGLAKVRADSRFAIAELAVADRFIYRHGFIKNKCVPV